MSKPVAPSQIVLDKLLWLKDAPLYIDRDQVGRFYDAIVRPENSRDETKLTLTSEKATDLKGTLGIEAGVEPAEVAGLLTMLLGLKPSVKGTGEAEAGRSNTDGRGVEITLKEINTPQRQLEQLIGHYLVQYPKRVFLSDNQAWRDKATISEVPRAIVFLDLPGRTESEGKALPRTKLIPMAAEFVNGATALLFQKIAAKNGERPPAYPEGAETSPGADARFKDYWKWFDVNFSSKGMMGIVEEAASANGRIRWIDFRVPLTSDGDTLHLHISPAAEFDTGVFAYNFINRGFTHGVRIVGTMKSGPDMNVLAIYEK